MKGKYLLVDMVVFDWFVCYVFFVYFDVGIIYLKFVDLLFEGGEVRDSYIMFFMNVGLFIR